MTVYKMIGRVSFCDAENELLQSLRGVDNERGHSQSVYFIYLFI